MKKFLHTSILEYVDSYNSDKERETLHNVIQDYAKDGNLENFDLPVIKNKNHKWLFSQLISMTDEIRKHNITTSEMTNFTNWGLKPNGNLGIFDIGYGDYFENFEHQPEELNMNSAKGEKLLDKIKSLLDIEESEYIGSGMFGHAHDIGDNKVLKITKDKSEAINSKKVLGKELNHIAKIYLVKKFKTDVRTYYVIILEKLKMDNRLEKWYEDLKEIFLKYKSDHISQNIIKKFKNMNKHIGNFLEDIVTYGKEYTWNKWRDFIHNSEEFKNNSDIFQDVSDISEWIKDSKTNIHSMEDNVPDYIHGLVDDVLNDDFFN